MVAWALVIATCLILAVVVLVLARQGSPGKLSDEEADGWSPPPVMERPAGPDAEAMDADEYSGERQRPTT